MPAIRGALMPLALQTSLSEVIRRSRFRHGPTITRRITQGRVIAFSERYLSTRQRDVDLLQQTPKLNAEGQCCKVENADARGDQLLRLCRCDETEQAGDERNLAGNIAFRYPSHLPFADHVYCFDTLNGAPRRGEGSEALTGSHPAFDRPVILLYNIVQIAYGAAAATSAHRAVSVRRSPSDRRGCRPR